MIGVEINRVVYKGDGVTKNFPYSFTILEKKDIVVTLVNPKDEKKVLTSDYLVDMDKKEIVYPGYETGMEPAEAERPEVLPEGWYLVIQRQTKINQLADLGDKWPFNTIEDALDKATRIMQDIETASERHLTLSPDAEDIDPVLPRPQPNKGFYWDETGKKLVSADNPNLAAANAADSADSALESAKKAAASEARSSEYKSMAITAQEKAEAARDLAIEARDNAANSAAIASEKKIYIESCERNAAASAKEAATSAELAGTHEETASNAATAARDFSDIAEEASSKARSYATYSAKRASYANEQAEAAYESAVSAANAASAARDYAESAARDKESIENGLAVTANLVQEARTSAENAANSSDDALASAKLAQELYRRYCVDIVGPPPAAMKQADLFVAPGPAAMADMS